VVDDETKDMFLPNESKEVEKLMDNEFNLFVQNKSPHHIMNLLLEEQANRVLFGKNSNSDDFEDWMRCADQNEEKWNEQFKVAKGKNVSNIFQFDV
jgi:hypothetical protein